MRATRQWPGSWFVWWLGPAGVAVVVGAVWVVDPTLGGGAPTCPVPVVPHPPAGAYLTGGVPCHQAPRVRRALGPALAQWVLALDQLHVHGLADRAALRRRLARARRGVLSPAARVRMGRPLTVALARLLWRAERVPTARNPNIATAAFLEAVVAVNAALAARNLGFYLDGDVHETSRRRTVVVSTFVVTRVVRFRSGDTVERALLLRRLDPLNVQLRLLGFTRPAHDEALVLLDEVERLLLRDLLPAAARGDLPLLDHHTQRRSPRWARGVSRLAGEALRRELLEAPGVTSRRVDDLARLLRQRQRLVHRWQDRLAARGVVLEPPDRLAYGRADRRVLRRWVPSRELRFFDRVQRQLLQPPAARTLRQLVQLVAASVARHELQHRLDYRHHRRTEPPTPYRQRLAPLRDRRGRLRPRARRALHELSAYLAEIARDRRTLRTNLSLLARYVLDLDYHGRPEARAVQVLMEGLDALLNPALAAARVDPRRTAPDRAALAARFQRLLATPPALVRRMAGRLWRRLFGAPLAPLAVDRRARAYPAARCPLPDALPGEAFEGHPFDAPSFWGLITYADRVLMPKELLVPASRP